MRKLAAALAVVFVLLIGYSAWPFASLYGLARAVETRDAAVIDRRVDFPSVRRNLIDQIMQTYLRLTGKTAANSLVGNLAVAVAASIADPLVEKLLTAENFVAVLTRGWPNEGAGERPSDVSGLVLPPASSVWQLYANTEYGTGWVRISVPVDRPAQKRIRLRLTLSGATWVLSGVDLPVELQERLARELIKLDKH
jgi:DUF2939 family protein